VLLGVSGATLFVEITNPTSPRHLGRLATHTIPSAWRDVKVYQHYAFVVSEAFGHGMQVFDLSVLLDHEGPPATFDSVAHYDGQGLGSAHNIAINEDTGFAYIVGSNTCSGGLHIVDVRASREPAFAGCFSQDGYTHDVQCVLYEGPDGAFREREICYAANEDTLTIVDVTDKRAPRLVSRTSYPGVGYTHQVWTTEDQHFLLLNDELDEVTFGHPTRTRIWDITDLERPVVIGSVDADRPSIDHNLYVHRGLVFQANYRSGLLVYDLADVADGRLRRVGVFDVYRADDAAEFNGAWSVYPFFPSGTVAVSGIEQGLFLLDVAFEGHSH
jgi:choice-of-anchor B domain-containing protein